MKIGVIRYFPGEKVAENENVLRIKESLESLGHTFFEIDVFGNSLEKNTVELDVIFNLHFQYPKSTLTPQISFLWNPTEFYYSWGFKGSILNELSRDFFVSSGSEDLFTMIKNNRPNKNAIIGQVNHTISGPWHKPLEIDNRKLFYVGINWERASGKPGRYEELLTKLSKDQVLDIYGPKKIQGIKPWGKQYNYLGEIEFDGYSLVNRLRETGCALVLSSKSHIKSGILTNRFFEGLKAGVPIVIGNSAIPTWLQNLDAPLWIYDDSRSEIDQALQIESLLEQINRNPSTTAIRVEQTQTKLHEYELSFQLNSVIVRFQESISRSPVCEISLILFAINFEITPKYINDNLNLFRAAQKIIITHPLDYKSDFLSESGITAEFSLLSDFETPNSDDVRIGLILCGQELFDNLTPYEVSDYLESTKSFEEILVLAATEIGPTPRLNLPSNFSEYAPSQFIFPMKLLEKTQNDTLDLNKVVVALEEGAYKISPRVGQLLPYNYENLANVIRKSAFFEQISEFGSINEFLSPAGKVTKHTLSWNNHLDQGASVLNLLLSELRSRVLLMGLPPYVKKMIFKIWKLFKKFLKQN
jgi:hypothetical protein